MLVKSWLGKFIPTIINIAAKAESGVRFITLGKIATARINRIPWYTADIFDLAPESKFAELRTITAVIGRPPISPDTIFPTP